jgi:serine/threonine protein kinase
MPLTKLCPACAASLPEDAPDGALCPKCSGAGGLFAAAMAASPADSEVRETFGDFEIVDELGQGGMGTVYRARQISLGRMVALKVLASQFENDPDFIARFQREAKVAASLRHANLVCVYAAGEADGSHYIAMELIDGENLSQRLKQGRLSIPETLRICADVARGLQYGWEQAGLIHRDIKPGNVYLSQAGEAKLGDLGLAKSTHSHSTFQTHAGSLMGTPHYISPEQAQGDRELDCRADIYSLGCMLFEMLTGRTPYQGTSAASVVALQLTAPPPSILKVMPDCPLPVARLVSRMLKKSRHERPGSHEELIGELEHARAQIESGAMKAGSSPLVQAWKEIGDASAKDSPTAEESSHTRWIAIAAGVLVVAGLGWLLAPTAERQAFKQRPVAPTRPRIDPSRVATTPEKSGGLSVATKDAPLVNSLGMKFVSVPIVGGPTAGKRVLFSVWETRVQDYRVFVNETKREWPPAFSQTPAHPAVNVSWEDAQAFCEWLTAHERKAGRLGVAEAYRLPTDHEWSCAVGIGAREDAAMLPTDKGKKVADVFPWGNQWPPPQSAGNLAGEELRAELAGGRHDKTLTTLLPGWSDPFLFTAPVGSLEANALGLFDLSGNAREWCEDWLNKDEKGRVLRGGSWASGHQESLRSARRDVNGPTSRFYMNGFRCVLAEDAPAASTSPVAASTSPAPIKLWDSPDKIAGFEGARWDNGVVVLNHLFLTAQPKALLNSSIRARMRVSPDVHGCGLRVRRSGELKAESYWRLSVSADARRVFLVCVIKGKTQPTLQSWLITGTKNTGDWIDLKLQIIGDELSVWIDQQPAGVFRDATLMEPGETGIFAIDDGEFRDIEYVPLDSKP